MTDQGPICSRLDRAMPHWALIRTGIGRCTHDKLDAYSDRLPANSTTASLSTKVYLFTVKQYQILIDLRPLEGKVGKMELLDLAGATSGGCDVLVVSQSCEHGNLLFHSTPPFCYGNSIFPVSTIA